MNDWLIAAAIIGGVFLGGGVVTIVAIALIDAASRAAIGKGLNL